jgi:hypothetical protein
MADLTLTPAAVRGDTSKQKTEVGGAAINAGMGVYKDTNNKWQKLQATTLVAAGITGRVGIAITGCLADGAPIVVQTEGAFTGDGMTPGIVYFASHATAGLFAPTADVETANGYSTAMFIALSATRAQIIGIASGVTT